MSKTKLPYEDSENYRRLLAMIDPKQQTWDLSPNDIKAIGWAVDALEVFARRAGAAIVVEASDELEADNADELIEALKEGFAMRLADVEARKEEALRALRLIRHFAIYDAMEPKSIVSLCDKVLKGDL